MRWMMMALLVSLTALLLAAAGVAHHIWSRRSQAGKRLPGGIQPAPDAAEEHEVEL